MKSHSSSPTECTEIGGIQPLVTTNIREHSRAQSSPATRPGRQSLGTRQQQGEHFGAALAVDDAVDEVGAEAPLEGDHGFLRVAHVIAEPLQREEKAG